MQWSEVVARPSEKVLRQFAVLCLVVFGALGAAGLWRRGGVTTGVAIAMAERDLMPAVRKAAPADTVIADGFSCRHQIRDLAGREAVHSVRLLARAL